MSRPYINVTPLIDVLLVLLIIFMVVTPMKPSAFDARIPDEPTHQPGVQTHPDTLVVAITADSTLRLNKESLAASVDEPAELITRLSSVFHQRRQNMAFVSDAADGTPQIQRTVFIKAPRNIDYGSVAKVVDAVKMAGASPIGLQIDDLD